MAVLAGYHIDSRAVRIYTDTLAGTKNFKYFCSLAKNMSLFLVMYKPLTTSLILIVQISLYPWRVLNT